MFRSGPTGPQRAALVIAATAILASLFQGCQKRTPIVLNDLEPIYVKADPTGATPTIYYDAFILLQQGNQAYGEDRYEDAEAQYRRLLDIFPESELAGKATYNLGLALEQQGRWEEALSFYQRAGQFWREEFEPHEIPMREGACLERLGRWDEAFNLYDAAMGDQRTPALIKARLESRAGVALYYTGDPARAKTTLRDALDRYEGFSSRLSIETPSDIARAYFVLGEIFFDQFAEVGLDVPMDLMEQTLESKSRLLLLARAQYIRAIKTRDPEWMTASMYKIGLGYVTLRDEILNAPLPEDLTDEEEAEYRGQLLDAVEPLREKAVDVLSDNLMIARQLGIENQWVDMTEEIYLKIVEEE